MDAFYESAITACLVNCCVWVLQSVSDVDVYLQTLQFKMAAVFKLCMGTGWCTWGLNTLRVQSHLWCRCVMMGTLSRPHNGWVRPDHAVISTYFWHALCIVWAVASKTSATINRAGFTGNRCSCYVSVDWMLPFDHVSMRPPYTPCSRDHIGPAMQLKKCFVHVCRWHICNTYMQYIGAESPVACASSKTGLCCFAHAWCWDLNKLAMSDGVIRYAYTSAPSCLVHTAGQCQQMRDLRSCCTCCWRT